MKDLIEIVEGYMNQRTSTSTTTTSTSAPVTPFLVEVIDTNSSGNSDANAKFFKDPMVTSTTTEPSDMPTDKETGELKNQTSANPIIFRFVPATVKIYLKLSEMYVQLLLALN